MKHLGEPTVEAEVRRMNKRANTGTNERTLEESGGVRERILAAATDVLRTHGIQGLSQLHVAREAGVRQSHLTYYFPKREDLVEAVAMRFIDHAFGGIGALTAGAATDDRVATLRRMAAMVADAGHMRMFTSVIIEADRDPKLRAAVVRVTKQLQSAFAVWLGGEDASERAHVVLASLWGLGLYDFLIRPTRRSPLAATLLARIAALPGPRRK
jgi:AcrR family transcriptional regulator